MSDPNAAIAARASASVLLLPGLWNSGPEHWHTYWERAYGFTRLIQRDWETPARTDWVATIDAAVAGAPGAVVLAGHSLACTAIAHFSAATAHAARVRGALLVAPSDVEAPSYPAGTTGFAPMPLERLRFPSIVVASSDDEYVSPERARAFAQAWGSQLIEIGPAGHINSASRLGLWPEGFALLAPWLR